MNKRLAAIICLLLTPVAVANPRTPDIRPLRFTINGSIVNTSLHTIRGTLPNSLLLLQHGFQRKKEHFKSLAESLVTEHLAILTASLSEHQLGDKIFAKKFAEVISNFQSAAFESGSPDKFLLAGHSIGAAFVSTVASGFETSKTSLLKGLFLIDPVEKNSLLDSGVATLPANLPIIAIFGENGPCNNMGNALHSVQKAETRGPLLRLKGGSHCDAEAESTDMFCQSMCGRSTVRNVSNLKEILGAWAQGLSNDGVPDSYTKDGERLRELKLRGEISFL